MIHAVLYNKAPYFFVDTVPFEADYSSKLDTAAAVTLTLLSPYFNHY